MATRALLWRRSSRLPAVVSWRRRRCRGGEVRTFSAFATTMTFLPLWIRASAVRRPELGMRRVSVALPSRRALALVIPKVASAIRAGARPGARRVADVAVASGPATVAGWTDAGAGGGV